jgi:hypothetical protein
VFRWPVEFTALSRGGGGRPRAATLEITPRGAVFTLAALSHVGHPTHLAVLDAYVKGQVRQTATNSIGDDSRLVLSSLAAPLVAAQEFGIERLTLADLILLPRTVAPDPDTPLEAAGWRVRGPDSARFLLRVLGSPHDSWAWVRAAERFEPAGCLGTPKPGIGSPWHDVFVQAGEHPPADPVTVEVREPTDWANIWALLEIALAKVALARFARASDLMRDVGGETARILSMSAKVCRYLPLPPIKPSAIRAEAAALGSGAHAVGVLDDLGGLGPALAESIAARTPTELAASWQGHSLHVSLAPDLDGYQTLCLLPLRLDPLRIPDPSATFETMRDAAWAAIESLMGRPLAEYRTEPITLRLVADDGRTTTLDVGASIVIVRNQTVFTGWVGSDGRVMLKLFPPGGMAAR